MRRRWVPLLPITFGHVGSRLSSPCPDHRNHGCATPWGTQWGHRCSGDIAASGTSQQLGISAHWGHRITSVSGTSVCWRHLHIADISSGGHHCTGNISRMGTPLQGGHLCSGLVLCSSMQRNATSCANKLDPLAAAPRRVPRWPPSAAAIACDTNLTTNLAAHFPADQIFHLDYLAGRRRAARRRAGSQHLPPCHSPSVSPARGRLRHRGQWEEGWGGGRGPITLLEP